MSSHRRNEANSFIILRNQHLHCDQELETTTNLIASDWRNNKKDDVEIELISDLAANICFSPNLILFYQIFIPTVHLQMT